MRRDRVSDEEARAIWLRASQLQAEAERRVEERARELPAGTRNLPDGEGVGLDDVRMAAEEAGISPEFVQIALAEKSALPERASQMGTLDVWGSRLFLASSRKSIEVVATVTGRLDTVAAASLQAFSGHPCLLQPGEVADFPSSSGRVIVFNVPAFDWSVTANPVFVEKASMIGLRQLHVAIRPLPEDSSRCEVVVAGDLGPGMRTRWRWGALTYAGAGAAGGAAGIGVAGSAVAGALLALPAILGAAAAGGAVLAAWATGYRYYRRQVEESLSQALQVVQATARAMAANLPAPETRSGELPRTARGDLPG